MAIATGAAIAAAAGAALAGAAASKAHDNMEDRASSNARAAEDALRKSLVRPVNNMPTKNADEIRVARNMRLLSMSQRSSRESTFLSQTPGGNKMGG